MAVSISHAMVDLEPALHQALQDKALLTHRSISELVNDAVRESLREDRQDLAAFDERAGDSAISYPAFLERLKADGTFMMEGGAAAV